MSPSPGSRSAHSLLFSPMFSGHWDMYNRFLRHRLPDLAGVGLEQAGSSGQMAGLNMDYWAEDSRCGPLLNLDKDFDVGE